MPKRVVWLAAIMLALLAIAVRDYPPVYDEPPEHHCDPPWPGSICLKNT